MCLEEHLEHATPANSSFNVLEALLPPTAAETPVTCSLTSFKSHLRWSERHLSQVWEEVWNWCKEIYPLPNWTNTTTAPSPPALLRSCATWFEPSNFYSSLSQLTAFWVLLTFRFVPTSASASSAIWLLSSSLSVWCVCILESFRSIPFPMPSCRPCSYCWARARAKASSPEEPKLKLWDLSATPTWFWWEYEPSGGMNEVESSWWLLPEVGKVEIECR